MQVHRPVALFLQPNYLTRTLTAPDRLTCHFHNTAFLCERFSPFSMPDIFGDGVELFARAEDEISVACRLAYHRKAPNQGELALTLIVSGEEVYALGFSFVPGPIFGVADPTIILVSRMQGAARAFEEIRRATKMFADISPQALLFAALLGVADRFAIPRVLGVPGRLQPSYTARNAEPLQRNYDEFFAAAGATRAANGFFVYDRSAFTDIFDNMPAKHRARTKTKRRLKARIAADVAEILVAHALPELAAGWRRAAHFRIEHFATRVGERRGDAFATTGKPGCLLFGPYAYLEAGDYEVVFLVEALQAPANFTIEVTADSSQTLIARKALAEWRPPTPVALAFTLAEPHDDVEFRMFASAEGGFAVRGVEVRRRAQVNI